MCWRWLALAAPGEDDKFSMLLVNKEVVAHWSHPQLRLSIARCPQPRNRTAIDRRHKSKASGGETLVVTGPEIKGVLHQHSPLEAQLQVTLNIIPAHARYALPSGALTFVNDRTADYLDLPKDHSLLFAIP